MKSCMLCPCKSQKNYETCCKPLHTGKQLAPSALLLMRSRYSAYCLSLANYIIETTHPDHPDQRKKTWQWREEILTFSRDTEFLDLEILEVKEEGIHSFVTFTASLKQKEGSFAFTEKSHFEQRKGIWLYKEAEFL